MNAFHLLLFLIVLTSTSACRTKSDATKPPTFAEQDNHRTSKKPTSPTKPTTLLHTDGCAKPTLDVAIIRTLETRRIPSFETGYKAYKISDGSVLWSVTADKGFELVGCPDQGALFLASRQKVKILDYKKGEEQESLNWEIDHDLNYSCPVLNTSPLPDDTLGFMWSLGPGQTRGGQRSAYEEAKKRQCCLRGTAIMTKKGWSITKEEEVYGDIYSKSSSCPILSPSGLHVAQSKLPPGDVLQNDIGIVFTLPSSASPDRVYTTPLEQIDEDFIMYKQILFKQCSEEITSHVGVAQYQKDKGWESLWSTEVEPSFTCPAP